MKKVFTTKRLCRAGAISALYVALSYAFGALSYQGILQIRPAEALCMLPLLYGEAVPALYIGCMLANLGSPFFVYDVFLGSLATLLSALFTYEVGRLFKKNALRVAFGGLAPVLINAAVIPLIIVFLCDGAGGNSVLGAYLTYAASLLITESVWVYGLGAPLYLFSAKINKRGIIDHEV